MSKFSNIYNKTKNLFGSVRFYFIITPIFIILAILCFTWKLWSSFSLELPIDHAIWGQFGDFVGGTLGTIFSLISVVLVVWTFNIQNKTAETQRFNDQFFELLHLYQSEVNELNGQSERIVDVRRNKRRRISLRITKEKVQYNNKDFFDEEKKIIQGRYRNLKSYELNKTRCVSYYMLFYTENRSKMSAYFRTLYRIFELIDNSKLINEYQKKEYAKIVRAQLTESELFFLRYNAMTLYGEPFVFYINKYHILKHLPAFELLEFKDWWKNMNAIEKEGINIIYSKMRAALKKVFSQSKTQIVYSISLFPDNNSRYKILMTLRNLCDFSINITLNKAISEMSNEYLGLNKLNEKRIQQLLDCFIKEIFLYSNFNRFNDETQIETYSKPIITNNNIVEINSGIKNKESKPLVIKYSISNPSKEQTS